VSEAYYQYYQNGVAMIDQDMKICYVGFALFTDGDSRFCWQTVHWLTILLFFPNS
jgi:hypothetical protein